MSFGSRAEALISEINKMITSIPVNWENERLEVFLNIINPLCDFLHNILLQKKNKRIHPHIYPKSTAKTASFEPNYSSWNSSSRGFATKLETKERIFRHRKTTPRSKTPPEYFSQMELPIENQEQRPAKESNKVVRTGKGRPLTERRVEIPWKRPSRVRANRETGSNKIAERTMNPFSNN